MSSTVQARLDEPSRKELQRLVKELGWSPSRVVREGLLLLAACYPKKGKRRVIGAGRFASGIPDLGSNKDHLRDFGK
jgi:hypothetical protein